jgi:AraC-like DNA-binding protein
MLSGAPAGAAQMDQTTAAKEPTCLRFSTADWPEIDRLKAVREIYGRKILPLDVELLPQHPLDLQAEFRTLPGLALAYVTSSPMRARRTPVHLVNDDLNLGVILAGGYTLHQRGRESVVHQGEAVMSTCAEVRTTDISASRYLTFRLPRKPMATLVVGLDDCVARPIRHDTEALRLLVGYASILQDAHAMATAELRHLAVTHVYDLAALALGATRDATEAANLGGVRAARLRKIKSGIADHLGSELSIADVAARERLPVRYVQRLFESEGTTFTQFVLTARLARAHRLLSDPRLADRPISIIAFDVGFGTLSHFNHSFRRRFGLSPSDLRAQARRET